MTKRFTSLITALILICTVSGFALNSFMRAGLSEVAAQDSGEIIDTSFNTGDIAVSDIINGNVGAEIDDSTTDTSLAVSNTTEMVAFNTATSFDGELTCIPVQQLSEVRTQIECRLESSDPTTFVVAELGFPFAVTRLVKVSSSFAATVGTLYSPQLAENTITITAVSLGDEDNGPRFQAAPFDTLSLLLETNQSMGELKEAIADHPEMTISFLTPYADTPTFNEIEIDLELKFDGSLFLEAFTQYLSPGVFQFLKLGLACYEKTPETCLDNLIENL